MSAIRRVRRPSISVAGAAVAALLSGEAAAFKFDTGNPDLAIRWDNAIRYNLGVRMDKRDQTLGDSWALQGGEYKFDRGAINTNRLDLLSEFDFIYKKYYGFRVSGAAWYDAAYDDKVEGNPAFQAAGLGTAYPSNATPSGHALLPALGRIPRRLRLRPRLDLGTDIPLDVKLGRHTVIYGESLFTSDPRRVVLAGSGRFPQGACHAGVEAKELFLPLNQLSAHLQITDKMSVARAVLTSSGSPTASTKAAPTSPTPTRSSRAAPTTWASRTTAT